jgi:poly(3-hydroxybutyrate) depolymerase
MSSRKVALFAIIGVVLTGCGGGESSPKGGGGAGATGSGGTASGAAGSASGGGTTGQTAGSTGETAGTSGGGAGTTGETAGTAGTSGSTGSGGSGSGGTTGASGATGGGGTNGAGGTNAGGATGAAGTAGSARPSGPSAGCMADVPNEMIGQSVIHSIDITGMAAQYTAGYTHRKYCTTMPKNYNPKMPYPVIFYGPGCGATACENSSFTGRTDIFIVQAIAGADAKDANIVPKNGSPGCFQAGKESTADSPEGPYFDQVMNEVESKYCTDRGKIFAAGTSSGAWLSNYLACARGNRIRGTASDSGGIQFNRPTCTGGAAVMELPGDSAMSSDQEGHEIGAALARDMFIKLNGCSMTATTVMLGKASCQVYGNCASPVAWCNVGGSHQSGNSYLSPTGWAFWSMLQ